MKIVGIRYYENEKGKGTMVNCLKEMSGGDCKGYQEQKIFLKGTRKDLDLNCDVEPVFEMNNKGKVYLVDLKKI